jgi:valyl-tRNA synthetase
MIPFLTEEVWQLLGQYAPCRGIDWVEEVAESIMVAHWPQCNPLRRDARIEACFSRFQEVLRAVRDIRSRQNVAPRTRIDFSVRCAPEEADLLRPMQPYFESMAAARAVAWGPEVQAPPLSASATLPGMEVFVDLAGLIDLDAEIARIRKEQEELQRHLASKEKKLANEAFVSRAPADVVQKERDSLEQLKSRLAAATAALENMLALKQRKA